LRVLPRRHVARTVAAPHPPRGDARGRLLDLSRRVVALRLQGLAEVPHRERHLRVDRTRALITVSERDHHRRRAPPSAPLASSHAAGVESARRLPPESRSPQRKTAPLRRVVSRRGAVILERAALGEAGARLRGDQALSALPVAGPTPSKSRSFTVFRPSRRAASMA